MNVLKFGHSGDSGDLIVALPTIKQMGGGDIYFIDKPKCRPFTPRIGLLKRLLEFQPYIRNVLPWDGKEHLDYNFTEFRSKGIPFGVQLGRLHSNYLGYPTDFSFPWLAAEPSSKTAGRIVVSKTARYANGLFPWKPLVEQYSKEMIFVGLHGEYHDFCQNYGRIDYLATNDLYDVAAAIAGCELFIGNQSSPNAICEGLKHNMVQEVCLTVPDCIYPRHNAIHCFDGNLEFIACGKHFKHERLPSKKKVNRSITPLGGWKLNVGPNNLSHYDFNSLMLMGQREFQAMRKPIPDNLAEMIEEHTFSNPEYVPEPKGVEAVRDLIDRLYSGRTECS